jgi:integrase
MMAETINEALAQARRRGASVSPKNPKLEDLNIDWGKLRRYKIDPRTGAIETNGTREDHELAMEAIERIGMIPGGWPKSPPTDLPPTNAAAAPLVPSITLPEAAQAWLRERSLRNGERTVYAKKGHYLDFALTLDSADGTSTRKPSRRGKGSVEVDETGEALPRHLLSEKELALAAHVRLNEITKDTVARFKTEALKNTKAKTVDNKLMSLSDFFEYAIAHSLYTVSDKNPAEGLLILTKSERRKKADPYKEFTPTELASFFEPAIYKAAMKEPDFYWCPLLGLYSGMRISEATGIYCDDVKQASNGVHFIRVRKSKTNAGLRNVPIAQKLLDLGFLDFVARQREAGHERLFPARKLINGSYSKDLSDRMLTYLLDRGIRKSSDGSERKSFHSFRANVITELANKDANTIQVMRIVGHDFGQTGIETHAGYVRDLPDLKKVVDSMAWPIDIEGLRL